MALQTIKGGIFLPSPPPDVDGTAPSLVSMLLDAAGEKAAFIVLAPKTGTISKVIFRTGTVTTSGDADVRLETVSAANGDPTGTLFGTDTNVTVTLNASATFFTATLTAGAAVTKGDLFAVVIANTTGNYNIVRSNNDELDFPYTDLFTTVWTKDDKQPVVAFEYSDASYEPIHGVLGVFSPVTTTFNSSSSPDERGTFFQLPFPVRVTGAWVWLDLDFDATIKLYDSDGSTVLLSRTLDPQEAFGAAPGLHFFSFSSTAVLNANTNYRITVVPTTTSSIAVYHFDVPTVASLDAMQLGQNWHLTTRTDAGAWTQTTTARPYMGIIADQFDAGGAAGGLITHPGMAGGMRG